jgi:hypothetical protein
MLLSCVNPFHPNLVNDNSANSTNDSPEAVLQSLEQAYTQKNLQLFTGCLAPDFRFELLSDEVNSIGIDWNNDGFKDSWWGFEQEAEYHRNLFLEGSSDGSYPPPDQINLRLQVPPQEQWEADTQTGHEEWVVIPCLFDLQLLYTASNSSIASSGVARFYLKPVGNRWYIAVWRDESNI